jgi:hypothetical protein
MWALVIEHVAKVIEAASLCAKGSSPNIESRDKNVEAINAQI